MTIDPDTPDLIDAPEDHLVDLGQRFLQAMQARQAHDIDGAAELLREILAVEPRLAEPHLELGSILVSAGQLEEAEDHVREAVRLLDNAGQWVDDIPENVVRSLAYGLLGEVLRQRADTDEIVFGDATVFEQLLNESHAAFDTAARLDPDNVHAQGWSGDFALPPLAGFTLKQTTEE